MSLAEAHIGKEVPEDIRQTLVVADVPYWSFEGEERIGQLVIHKDLADDAKAIFGELRAMRFPIRKVVPIDAYGFDDEASMRENNTSAFNYRMIAGTDRLSNHAFGRAIDVNPLLNPYVRGELVAPAGAVYDSSVPGAITEAVAQAFLSRGWQWGGHWSDRKDWQHFEKPR